MKASVPFFSLLLLFTISALANPLDSRGEIPDSNLAEKRLFDSDEILDLTISGDIRALFNDRSDDAVYHPMEISYISQEGQEISIPLKIKTRGNFRRDPANCAYPPLKLNFAKKKTPENSLFYKQDKLKLVVPCKDDKYVVREYLVYKLYNILTEQSFRVRLARVVYADTVRDKNTDPLYGFILEDEDEMAKRNQAEIVERQGLRLNKTNTESFLKMAVFEYMIGNTDWSVQYQHNVKFLIDEATVLPYTVAYDFDHAGIVRTPYAKPAPELLMQSVRERRYRGYCIEDMREFDPVFAQFNALKDDFYRVYTECPLLEEKYVKATAKFLDEFYETINDPKAAARAFGYPCDKSGTGNVVIQGLGNN